MPSFLEDRAHFKGILLTKNTHEVPHTDCKHIFQIGKKIRRYKPPPNCIGDRCFGAEILGFKNAIGASLKEKMPFIISIIKTYV